MSTPKPIVIRSEAAKPRKRRRPASLAEADTRGYRSDHEVVE
jgi:hypothetical protein